MECLGEAFAETLFLVVCICNEDSAGFAVMKKDELILKHSDRLGLCEARHTTVRLNHVTALVGESADRGKGQLNALFSTLPNLTLDSATMLSRSTSRQSRCSHSSHLCACNKFRSCDNLIFYLLKKIKGH